MLSTLETSPEIVATIDPREPRAVFEARRNRSHAVALLRSLEQAQSECQTCLAESHRSDAMQSVRGESSLDVAIQSTRDMIRSLDRVIAG